MDIQNQIVTEEDFNFLYRLVSLQRALIISSDDPVSVWRPSEGVNEGVGYPGMYCDDVEDRGTAMFAVDARVENAKGDIRKHYERHKNFVKFFLDMDMAIIANNRGLFGDSCEKLVRELKLYCELVEGHNRRMGREAFLVYPHTGGEAFHIPNCSLVETCVFNLDESLEGILIDIRSIEDRSGNFKVRREDIPYLHIPLDLMEGAGLYDSDFKKHLVRNRNLLRVFGLIVE